jgi:hypothetical protein
VNPVPVPVVTALAKPPVIPPEVEVKAETIQTTVTSCHHHHHVSKEE